LAESSDEMKAYWGSIAAYVIVRTKFLDDYANDAAAAGIRQFVVLGAGLDARAFRLDWPEGTRVFELDVHDVNEFKKRALARVSLQPRVERVAVEADLIADWMPALARSGFDPLIPTAWAAEGLLIYFTNEQNERLISTLSDASSPGSRIAMTLARKGSLDVPEMFVNAGPSGDRSVPGMWKSESPGDPASWLRLYGWEAEVFDSRERAAAYGRPLPVTAPESSVRALVRAVRL
ncbi:MAG TPA: SAM-dependent methyltransferase, partial [Actinomycetota bacterium]|nr:SAM-dependent methyltransferase [Actinomycetota bacterium]